MSNAAGTVSLAAGEAELRPLTGDDEAFVAEREGRLLPAALATELLARCVTRVGGEAPVTADRMRELTIGDREALFLHLRRLVSGERLACGVKCPRCGDSLQVVLTVSEVLVAPDPRSAEWHETSIEADGRAYHVRFRVPTGADQEAAAPLALRDPAAAEALLVERCIDDADALPASAKARVVALMAEFDPQAEVTLKMTCPVCATEFRALFDSFAYLRRELAARQDALYREFHLLAFHYHWSERDIAALPTRKRQRYLELLEREEGIAV